MSQNEITTGIDIGTDSIKLLSVVRRSDSDLLEVVAKGMIKSDGIRKGVVIEPEKVIKKIQQLLNQIKEINTEDIQDVVVSINGKHIYTILSKGLISVSRADQTISQDDADRAMQTAEAMSLPPNFEIIDSSVKDYIIDGQDGIKQPVGMKGGRLEVEVLNCCAFSPYVRSIRECIVDLNLGLIDYIPSPLASSRAVLTSQQKELGVLLIDIGSATTSIAVFEEGCLLHSAIFPIGSSHITNDIAIGLKVDVEVAERIKKEFGVCIKKKGYSGAKKIKIINEKEIFFSQKVLFNIIEARVLEIFDIVNQELKKIDRQGNLRGGVVFVGGGAHLKGIDELAKKELKLPAKIGKTKGILGLEEDPVIATLAGLVLFGVDLSDEVEAGSQIKIIEKISKLFNIFKP